MQIIRDYCGTCFMLHTHILLLQAQKCQPFGGVHPSATVHPYEVNICVRVIIIWSMLHYKNTAVIAHNVLFVISSILIF